MLSIWPADPWSSSLSHRRSASTIILVSGYRDSPPGGLRVLASLLGGLFTLVEVGEPPKTRRHTARASRERQRKPHTIGRVTRSLNADPGGAAGARGLLHVAPTRAGHAPMGCPRAADRHVRLTSFDPAPPAGLASTSPCAPFCQFWQAIAPRFVNVHAPWARPFMGAERGRRVSSPASTTGYGRGSSRTGPHGLTTFFARRSSPGVYVPSATSKSYQIRW
jgi:hypothetical protein